MADAGVTDVSAYRGSMGTQNGQELTVLGVPVPMALLGAVLNLSITTMPIRGPSVAIEVYVTALRASACATIHLMGMRANALNVGMIAMA